MGIPYTVTHTYTACMGYTTAFRPAENPLQILDIFKDLFCLTLIEDLHSFVVDST